MNLDDLFLTVVFIGGMMLVLGVLTVILEWWEGRK